MRVRDRHVGVLIGHLAGDVLDQQAERIAAAALKAKKAVSVYTGGGPETTWLQALGASMFVLSSDQGFLRNGAAREMGELRKTLALAKPAT